MDSDLWLFAKCQCVCKPPPSSLHQMAWLPSAASCSLSSVMRTLSSGCPARTSRRPRIPWRWPPKPRKSTRTSSNRRDPERSGAPRGQTHSHMEAVRDEQVLCNGYLNSLHHEYYWRTQIYESFFWRSQWKGAWKQTHRAIFCDFNHLLWLFEIHLLQFGFHEVVAFVTSRTNCVSKQQWLWQMRPFCCEHRSTLITSPKTSPWGTWWIFPLRPLTWPKSGSSPWWRKTPSVVSSDLSSTRSCWLTKLPQWQHWRCGWGGGEVSKSRQLHGYQKMNFFFSF